MQQLIIDRKKWRTGGASFTEKVGPTQLLNREGYMCCLGFYSLQVGNKTEEEILNMTCPYQVEDKTGIESLVTQYNGDGVNSSFAHDAIEINDNDLISNEDREQRLIELFKGEGIEISFINEY